MRQAVRAVVVKGGNLLVVHRNKFGKEYYTLPGGGIDPGETPEQAMIRELYEETGISVVLDRLVIVEEAGDPFGVQYVYLCTYQSGEPALHPDSEEAQINKLGQNMYTPLWLPLSELSAAPFFSEKLKLVLLKGIAEGFPEAPEVL